MSRPRRRRGRIVREKCGCKYDDASYIDMCTNHRAEWSERHERARRDHAEQDPRRR